MRKFFNKMKIVDEQIVETLHPPERASRQTDGAVLSSRRRRIDDVPHGEPSVRLCVDDCFRNSAECAARVRTYGGSFRGFRLLLDSSGFLRI